MKCFLIDCEKSYKLGWRIYRNSKRVYSCWNHLTEAEKRRFQTLRPRDDMEKRPLTGEEAKHE